MNVGELKRLIADLPDDMRVFIDASDWTMGNLALDARVLFLEEESATTGSFLEKQDVALDEWDEYEEVLNIQGDC